MSATQDELVLPSKEQWLESFEITKRQLSCLEPWVRGVPAPSNPDANAPVFVQELGVNFDEIQSKVKSVFLRNSGSGVSFLSYWEE